MKQSLIILLLCSCLIAGVSTRQCLGDILNCANCINNNLTTTNICTACDQSYKPNSDKSVCTYCPMEFCQSCELQNSVCFKCFAKQFSQFKLQGTDVVTCIPCYQFCQQCSTPNFCTSCSLNSNLFAQSPDLNGRNCIQCTVPNCLRCHQQDKCKICQNGYVNSIGGQCKNCNVDNCLSCSTDDFCQSCINGFSLTSTGKCIVCKQPCSECDDDGNCKTCQVPFWNSLVSTNSQNSGQCFRPVLKNCREHQQADNSKCSACNIFFEYNEDSNTCQLACASFCLTCDSVDTTKCLSCPQNYFLTSDNQCNLCPIGRTGNNPFSTSCDFPKIGYYLTALFEFKNCPGFCRSCQGPSLCTQLIFKFGRTLVFSKGEYKLARCAGNCKQCAGGNVQYCTTCWDGFFNAEGICKPCDSSCKSCSAIDTTICNSCYFGAFLQQNVCISCDSNCLTCKSSTQLTTCISCRNGWLLNTDSNTCQQSCPSNCGKCDSTTNCLKCNSGFTTFLDIGSDFTCIPCMQNCRTCMENQPSVCLDCGDGFWTLTGQTCNQLSFSFCKKGDQQQCFQCIDGYQLIDRLTCQPQCEYPCATCNSFNPNSCTSCIAGYRYQDITQQCIPQTDCNNDCNVCPFGYSLKYGNCLKCDSSLVNCQRCDTDTNTCYSCMSGYYIDSAGSCIDCPSQCKECYSSTQCSTCRQGYFLNPDLQTCQPCSTAAGCQTCSRQAAFCTTCLPGYAFNGWKCSKNEGLNVELTFSKSITQFNSLYLNRFIIFFLNIFGLTDFNFFTLSNLVSFGGSTRIAFVIAYQFGFDQAAADLQLKAAYDAIYGSNSIILDDLTVTGFKATHRGGFANIFDNFCSSFKTGCTKCQFNTANCIQCPTQLSLVSNLGDGYCISCNVQNCDQCLVLADFCSICDNGYYLDSITNPNIPSCKPCTDKNCETCYQVNTCASCLLGFVADELQVCVRCTLANCYQCGTPFYCSICSELYDLDYSKGECFLCQLANCVVCQNVDRCSVCDAQNNFTINYQTGLCQKCALSGCSQCQTTTVCSTCLSGYSLFINSGQCIPCNIAGCNNGCVIPNVCSDAANCAATDTIAVNPQNQDQTICIACDIKNCIECIWDNYCYTCDNSQVATLGPDVFGQICIRCDVNDCAICWQTDICAFCLYPSQLNTKLNKCVFCNVDNCLQCSSMGFCQTCLSGYTSSSTGDCFACSQQCESCLPTGQCVTCAQPKYNYLPSTNKDDFGQCFKRLTPNCVTQDRENHQICLECVAPYKWDSDKGQCTNDCDIICYTCDPNQLSLCLSCRTGFFLDGNTCTQCQTGCGACSSQTLCLSALSGYFIVDGGSIGVCENKCKKCASQKVCLQLQNSDGQTIVTDQTGQTQVLVCSGTCQKCQNSQKCLDCKDGFYLKKGKQQDIQGICFACDPTCKTCDRNDPTICISCPDNYFLSNRKCKTCDDNCYKCKSSAQPQVCTFCINGRWLNKQTNKCIDGCPDNCLSCQSATNCLTCNSGYTTLLDTVEGSETFNQIVCTPCVVTCRVCVAGQPSNCIECGDGFYQQKGQCIPCIQNCKSCSQKQCTACFDDYDLVSNPDSKNEKICSLSCVYPCSQCTIGKPTQCTKCAAGYSLNGNICNVKTQCSGDQGCAFCPSGYVLDTGVCVACPTQFCQKCLVDSKTTCLGCIVGYHLDASDTCQTCPTQCKDCYSTQQCISCNDGYILQKKKRKRGYKCIKCDDKCKTCKRDQNKCTSCAEGYQLNGWKCDQIFKASLGHTFDCTPKQFFLQSRVIMFIFLKILGIKNPDAFSFLSIKQGSVILASSVQLPGGPGSDAATSAFSSIKDAATAGSLGNLKVTASSVVVKGGALSSSASSSNLGIILGICIPIGVLLIVGIIMFIVYKTKNVENYKFSQGQGQGTDRENRGAGDSKAKIEYDDNSLI